MIKRLAVLVSALILLVIMQSSAFAQTDDQTITAEHIVDRVEVEIVDTESGVCLLSNTRAVTGRVAGKNIYGVELWAFYHRIEWGWNDTMLNYVSISSWGETYSIGWSYKGLIKNTSYFYNNYASLYSYRHGHFSSLFQNKYPWIDFSVHAGGSYEFDAGVT